MPVIVDPAILAGYGKFPQPLDRDWLGRVTHLSAADVTAVRRRGEPVTQLGFAVQLAAVRAIGMFVSDLSEVPIPFAAAVADQLLIDEPMGLLAEYARAAVRWRHTAEIRQRYGYHTFGGVQRWLFTRWLYRQAWDDDLTAGLLFRAAHHQLVLRRILLPGHSVLARLIATVRERAAHRAHARLIEAAPAEVRARLEKLLLVVEGGRYSELDLLRRPPFTPTIGGLVKALERLGAIRALGVGDLDLSTVPQRRVAALARYADQAWATQLGDLAPARRVATLVAYLRLLTGTAGDDVLDIFDVVFGDLQRAATHRGQKRRVGELRDYDRAVGELHTRMRALLDALDAFDAAALTGVLNQLRDERAGIDAAMAAVEQLRRPPGDPFHERLVAVYPQIRRFLPLFIDAFDLASIPAATPVLNAYHALDRWLIERPRTPALPAADLPLEVVTPSWEPHVRNPDGMINRAGYTCCVLDALRQRLRRRDIFLAAPAGATPEPRCCPPPPGRLAAPTCVMSWAWTRNRTPSSRSWPPASTRRGGTPPAGWRPTLIYASSTVTAVTRSC